MNYLIAVGVLGVILLLVKNMMDRARTDEVIADLARDQKAKKAKEAFNREVGSLTGEIEHAKLDYRNARREFDESISNGAELPAKPTGPDREM